MTVKMLFIIFIITTLFLLQHHIHLRILLISYVYIYIIIFCRKILAVKIST